MASAALISTAVASSVRRQADQGWTRVFGYDIFISFALGPPPRGARGYASDLARRLRERGFTVFFSEDEAPAGGELDQTLKGALGRSRVLVVVANRGTLQEPRWVRSEVEEFRRRHPRRTIVPISIDGALLDPKLAAATEAWLPFAQRIWIDESREAGESGSVSEDVIDRLVTAPHAIRSRTRLRAAVGGMLTFFALLAAVALWQKYVADANAEDANVQRGQAEQQARRADEAASQARAAASAAEVARAKEQDARIAEQQQRELAEQRMQIAQSRELAVSAAAQLAADPELSVLLAKAGVELSPTLESQSALRVALLEPRGRRIVTSSLGAVWDLAFSPDGKRLVSVGEEGASVSDVATGAATAKLHGLDLRTVAISADGRYAVLADQGRETQIWRLGSSAAEFRTPQHAMITPNSQLAVTFGDSSCAQLRAVATGVQVSELCGDEGRLRSVAFNSGGTLLMTSSDDGAVRVWDLATGGAIRELRSPPAPKAQVAFSPDGRLAATITRDTMQFWNTRTWKPAATIRTEYSIDDAVFSPDGERVAVVQSLGFQIPIFSTRDGAELVRLVGHTGFIFSAAFSPNGLTMVTASEDKTARVWDTRSGSGFASLRGHRGIVTSARFSPDGRRIATSSLDGTVRIWEFMRLTDVTEVNPAGPRIVRADLNADSSIAWLTTNAHELAALSLADRSLRVLSPIPSRNMSVPALSHDGRIVATADSDDFIRIRRVPGGAPIVEWPHPYDRAARLVFSPDSTRLLSTGGSAVLWNVQARSAIATLDGPTECLHGGEFSPNGAYVLTLCGDAATLWDGHRGKRLATLPASPGRTVTSARFSHDSQHIVTTSVDRLVRLWRTGDATPLRELEGHTDAVMGAWFSADGKLVVSVGQDRTARVWDTASGQAVTELRGNRDNWAAASFAPSGTLVLTTGGHNATALWDARTGARLIELESGVDTAAFGRDSRHIVLITDGRVRVYPCAECGGTAELLRLARARAVRELSVDERRLFLHEKAQTQARALPAR